MSVPLLHLIGSLHSTAFAITLFASPPAGRLSSLDTRGRAHRHQSLCSASTKGVAPEDQGRAAFLCHCHTPTRYVWDLRRTFAEQASFFTTPMFWLTSHYLRLWDFSAAQRVDHLIATLHITSPNGFPHTIAEKVPLSIRRLIQPLERHRRR